MKSPWDTPDIFDSREVEDRIKDLEWVEEQEQIEDYEKEELDALREFRTNVNSSEWSYGLTFVRDDYFEDYARQTAEDIGAIDPDVGWPAVYIDWKRAAEALQMDYSSVELNGVTYWYRE